MPVILEVSQGSLDQIDATTSRVLCSYDYKDIEGMRQVNKKKTTYTKMMV